MAGMRHPDDADVLFVNAGRTAYEYLADMEVAGQLGVAVDAGAFMRLVRVARQFGGHRADDPGTDTEAATIATVHKAQHYQRLLTAAKLRALVARVEQGHYADLVGLRGDVLALAADLERE